jgi:hypothetical protein
MDLEEINTFLEVVRAQSLVTAARHLHVRLRQLGLLEQRACRQWPRILHL